MTVYKISVGNKELKGNMPAMYFQEKRTAEAVVNTFNSLLVKGKVIEWICEEVEVLSHEEALKQFTDIADKLH